jgi:DNA repair protein RecO (recombination protein O)
MSELYKTRAIVLRKLDYGDTSRIIQFFTEDFGKISAILKGARSAKSKKGLMIDTFNYVQLVLYKKETREVQLVSEVDMLNHFPNIKEEYDRIKYASAVIELLLNLTVENEHHHKMFAGSIRALELLNTLDVNPKLIFAKYFLFFVKEIGYELQLNNCSICGKDFETVTSVSFNYSTGMVCNECGADNFSNTELSKELFNLLQCLSSKKNNIQYDENNLNKIILLIEKFLKQNIHEFKGLKSLLN